MTRRDFFLTSAGATLAAQAVAAPTSGSFQKMGLNSYCLRALKWPDKQILDYAASLKLDGVFLQDSLDPDRDKLEHWSEIGKYARGLDLHIETGIGAVLPVDEAGFARSRQTLLTGLARSKACGSPLVRCLQAPDRAHLPQRSFEQNRDAMVRLLQSVRSQFTDAGIKIAIENHKDLQAWEMREVIEAAGKDWVGSYLDTGNPVFVVEDPVTTVETLAPYALCVHLRDSIVYERPGGAMVEWVPLGEGNVDFHKIVEIVRQTKPDVYIYIKPITGRPAQLLRYLEPDFWRSYPKARAFEFARFLLLAKRGGPYDKPVVLEDLPGRRLPEALALAVQYQQRDHMERSVAYARKSLNLGVRWRG
jgi:sugar phosphate isomerase/epimerase